MKVNLNQQKQLIQITDFEFGNQLVFTYFDSLPKEEREDKLLNAIYIGVLAQKEDRLSAFLSSTANQLGTELENLKIIFDMKQVVFEKTTVKGVIAEKQIAEHLQQYLAGRKIHDRIELTGDSVGEIEKNKTGDILCYVDCEKPDVKIAIECKFDKSVKLGDPEDKNLFLLRKTDTAWSQIIESSANRGTEIAIIVFDRASVDNSIIKFAENVGFIPGIGFTCIVDSQRNDYTNLIIAYFLARNIAVSAKDVNNIDTSILEVMITRIVKDLKEVILIKSLVEANISNNKEILKQVDKAACLIEFDQKFLGMFLRKGSLTKKELLDFYNAEGVPETVKAKAKEIDANY